MALGNEAALLLRIKGDSSDAVSALNKVKKEAGDLKPNLDGLESALSGLVNPAALVTAGVTAIAAAAVAGGLALFNLAKNTAEYGSAIFDASQKTGLGAETMSALKVAAEQSGSSFEGVTNAVAKFNVLIGNAAAGNDKAEKILHQYGITAKDTQGALEQAVTRIAEMTSASEQAAAAGALFKDRTGEILPVIKSFDGDLPGLIENLRELGVLMSDEDAKAADEFGDQIDTLNLQLASLGRTLGTEVIPVFNELARDISKWLSENKGEVKAWAESISYWVQRTIGEVRELQLLYQQARDFGTRNNFDNGGLEGFNQRQAARDVELQKILNQRGGTTISGDGGMHGQADDRLPGGRLPPPIIDAGELERRQEAAKKAAEKAAKEAEDLRKRQLQGQLGQITALQNAEKDALERTTAFYKEEFEKRSITAEEFVRNIAAIEEDSRKRSIEDIEREYELRRKQEKLSSEQLKALKIEEQNELEKLINDSNDRVNKAQKEATEQKKKLSQEALEDAKEKMGREVAEFEAEAGKRYAVAVQYAEKEKRTADDLAKFKDFLEASSLEYRLDKLRKYFGLLDKGSKEYLDVQSKIKVLEQQLEEQRAKNATNEQKRHDERIESWNEYVKKVYEAIEAEDARQERNARRQLKQNRDQFESEGGLGEFEEGVFGELPGFDPVSIFGDQDVLLEGAEFIKNVWTDLEGHVGGAIGNMVNGLAAMGAAWLSTGKFSAQAALQMASSVALSLAMQAAVSAVMELARGWAESAAAAASAAVFDYAGAALHTAAAGMHFSAAAIYGTVAGVAGAVGVGLGLAARAAGGDKSKSASSSFKAQTSQSRQGSGEGQGEAYSSFGNEAYEVDESRNAPLGVQVEISFRDRPDWFPTMFEADWRGNGKIRRLVEDGR